MLLAVTVANEACAMVGANPVQSLDVETPTNAAVKAAYGRVLGALLGIHPFSFATSTRQLAQRAGATPLTGYDHVYDLPADRLGPPLRISDTAADPRAFFTAYLLEGDTVHASASPLFARILVAPAPHLWSPLFRAAMTTALAADLALSVKRAKDLHQILFAEAFGSPIQNYRGGQLGAAIAADSFATPSIPNPAVQADPLTGAWRS